ncbi:MAG: hypothetical protein ACPGSC_02165 [Granulosicoccaceae bacterium]
MLFTALLATLILGGCHDDTSIREFGSGTTGTTSGIGGSGSAIEIIDVGSTLAPGEFLLADFAISPAGKVSINADLSSGQEVEVYFLNETEWYFWREIENNGGDVSSYSFLSAYPDLESALSTSFNSPQVTVDAGFYGVLIENTDAGFVQPDPDGESSAVSLSVSTEAIDTSSDAPTISSVRVKKSRIGKLD